MMIVIQWNTSKIFLSQRDDFDDFDDSRASSILCEYQVLNKTCAERSATTSNNIIYCAINCPENFYHNTWDTSDSLTSKTLGTQNWSYNCKE